MEALYGGDYMKSELLREQRLEFTFMTLSYNAFMILSYNAAAGLALNPQIFITPAV